jgi:prepilin-type N-terminal cleavage/methylation domain-containing protein
VNLDHYLARIKGGFKMFTKITKKAERGFTLIELMIVIAILVILAVIAYPQVSEYLF